MKTDPAKTGALAAVLLGGLLVPALFGVTDLPAAPAAAPTAGEPPVTLHVAIDGDDAWSGRLAVPNADRTDGPFATLDRARREIRGLKVDGELPAAVRVEIHGGTHVLAEPLRFTPDDSGSPPRIGDHNKQVGPERSVAYAAATGERPVISGGRRITGWSRGEVAGHEAWMATLPEVRDGRWNFTQLWVDGRRAPRPRLPRSKPGPSGRNAHFRIAELLDEAGFDGPISRRPSIDQERFLFAGDDLTTFHNLAEVEFVALHFFIESRIPFAAIDPAAKTARLQWKSRLRLTDDDTRLGAPYYVENVREALDTPGQWYLDRISGVLTYLPRPGESPETTAVIAPVLPQLVLVEGVAADGDRPARHVEWLRFDGLTFSHSEWVPGDEARTAVPQAACHLPGTVGFLHSRHCSLREGGIEHVGSYGLEIRGDCSDIDVVGNTIADLAAGGVKVWHGDGPGDSSRRITIADNVIADGGHRHHQGVGVLVGNCSGIRVIHNHIHDFDYTGISVGWTWGYADSRTSGNVIERNHVHDIGRGMLSDMGGIYMLGVSPGTRIRHNVIHDVEARGYGGWGIYLDEGSTGLLVESNLVYRTKSEAFTQHYGRDNVIRNNILAFGREGLVSRARVEPHESFAFTRNVVVANNDGKVLTANWKSHRGPQATVDYNLYFHAGDPPQPLLFAGGDFAAWQGMGLDVHGMMADPLLRDPLRGDFRMDPRSPAIATLGFVPWDFDNVGPRTGLRRGSAAE